MKQQVYLTIIGKNEVGIIASVSNCLLNYRISIQDITQKIGKFYDKTSYNCIIRLVFLLLLFFVS